MRQGLNRSLLRRLGQDGSRQTANGVRLRRLLEADDVAGLRDLFHAFYAGIPHQWYANNDIADYEGFYASVFYSYFAGLGLDVAVEDSTNRGRLDMAVRFEGRVYLFEFKVVEQAGAGAAMAQLVDRGYADKYRSPGVRVHLVGVGVQQRVAQRGGVRARHGVTVARSGMRRRRRLLPLPARHGRLAARQRRRRPRRPHHRLARGPRPARPGHEQ